MIQEEPAERIDVKINPLSEAFRYLNLVQKKDDAGGNSRGQQQDGKNPKKDPEQFEVDEEKVKAAISAFGSDAQTQVHGLSASSVGAGPGLKVVLKDGSGAVVRQLTGEEFLRLREAAGTDARVRGKILDQKL